MDTFETDVNEGGDRIETSPNSRRYPASNNNDNKEIIGMKVTATVPPLPNLLQRNQTHHTSSMQNQAASAHKDDEGSFAAALRKLAQQAIVPVARRPAARERQPTSPISFKPGIGSFSYLEVTVRISILYNFILYMHYGLQYFVFIPVHSDATRLLLFSEI